MHLVGYYYKQNLYQSFYKQLLFKISNANNHKEIQNLKNTAI